MIQKEAKERFLSTDLYMTMKKRMKQKNSETIEMLLKFIEMKEARKDDFYKRWQFRIPSLLLFLEVNPLSLTQHCLALGNRPPSASSSSSSLSCMNQLTKVLSFELSHSPPLDVKANLDRNSCNFNCFLVLNGLLWVYTFILAGQFLPQEVNFSRGRVFLMYRNSRVHPLTKSLPNTMRLKQWQKCN